MSFQLDLLGAMRSACGPSVLERGLSAADAARAVSPKLPRRTVEDWIQGRRTPPDWTQDWILSRVASRAKAQARKLRPSNVQSEPRRYEHQKS